MALIELVSCGNDFSVVFHIPFDYCRMGIELKIYILEIVSYFKYVKVFLSNNR